MTNAIFIDGAIQANTALDWIAFNFINCSKIGLIRNVANFVNFQIAYIESGGLDLDGTIGSVVFDSSLVNSNPANYIIKVLSTCTITRRLRFVFSPFIVVSGETGIIVENTSSIPVDSFILDKCNFSGGGSYISGVTATDNISDWTGNKGIQNSSSSVTLYYNTAQAATTITTSAVYQIANVNWVVGSTLQRFTVSGNRITYTGAITQNFIVFFNITLTSNSNNQIGLALYKNGSIVLGSETLTTTNGNNRSENITISTIVPMTSNDYIELYVKNNNNTQSVQLQLGNGYLITN